MKTKTYFKGKMFQSTCEAAGPSGYIHFVVTIGQKLYLYNDKELESLNSRVVMTIFE